MATILLFFASLLAAAQQPVTDSMARIEGIVVKAGSDEPLANAFLLLSGDGGGQLDIKYSATSRSDGHFTLKDIPKGRYRLSVSKPGFVDQEYGRKKLDESGAVLDLTVDQTLRDITIRLIPGGVIAGRAYDQDGGPLEGAVISAFHSTYRPDGRSSLSSVSIAVTNDLGEYRLYWLSPGTYYLYATLLPFDRRAIASPIGASTISRSDDAPEVFAPAFYPNGDNDAQASPIRVEAGDELRGLDFSLTRMKAVKIQGRIIDGDSSQPVRNADLLLVPKYFEADSMRVLTQRAHSSDEGRFDFSNVVPGGYSLSGQISMPGFRSLSIRQDLQVGDRDELDLEVRLKPDATIRGRLVMEGDAPLPQNRTLLTFYNYDRESNGAYLDLGAGVDENGTFSVSNLPPGIWHLELTGLPDNFYIRSARSDHADVLEDGVDVTEGSVDSLVVVVGQQAGSIEGIVSDDHQVPVIGARVVLTAGSSHHPAKSVTTDQAGRFRIAGIAPGDFKLYAWRDVEPNIYFNSSFMERFDSQGKLLHMDANGTMKITLSPIPMP